MVKTGYVTLSDSFKVLMIVGETDPDTRIKYHRVAKRGCRAKRECELLCLGKEGRSLQNRWTE